MKTALVAAALALTLGSAASAAGLHTVPQQRNSTCAGLHGGAMQAAYVMPQAAPAPTNCCDGQLKCAQYLPTTTLQRAKPQPRT